MVRRRRKRFLATLIPLLALLSLFYFSGRAFADRYRVPLMKNPPKIDGFVHPGEWKDAVAFDGFSLNGNLEERKVRAYIGATEKDFYIAIVSELPPVGKILAQVKRNSSQITYDDAVEIWIDPTPGAATGRTYQMLANSRGQVVYLTHFRGAVKGNPYGWKGNYKMANGFHRGFWDFEAKIPLNNLVRGRGASVGKWGINLARDFKRPWDFTSLGNRGFNPDKEIIFSFSKTGLATQYENLKDPTAGNVDGVLSLYNPGASSLQVKARLFLRRSAMPAVVAERVVTIAAGKRETLPIEVTDHNSKKFKLLVEVQSPGGEEIYYQRSYHWGPPRKRRWTTEKIKILPVNFQFAYYPYLNKMRILADISGLNKKAKLKKLVFTIREKKSKKVIKQFVLNASAFKNSKAEKVFALPPLSGSYEIVLQAEGKGVPRGEVIKTFRRTVFKWEHTKLGGGTRVYPPFTPIRVKGRDLYTVLKEYRINNLGLLDQVKTEDQLRLATKELLASPMNYRATIAGEELKPEVQELKFLKEAGDRVSAASRFSFGPLKVNSKSTLDYDGTLKITLELLPTAGKRVDSFFLDIPLKNKMVTMFEAMADGIRSAIISAYIPAGEGVIWTAKKVRRVNYPKNFATYIFLGNPRRGLSWFASNDRGWSWNRETPNLELIRNGDTLTLRINLINKPLIINKPRRITFGLLAAPVKPRLKGWRYKWYKDKYGVLGTGINWGSWGIATGVYPPGKDLELWRMLGKENTRGLSPAERAATLKRGEKDFAPYGKEAVRRFVRNYGASLRNKYKTTMVFYYNRSSFASAPEFQTFMNEWSLNNYSSSRGVESRREIDLVPSASYIDYALYWYGKSFDIANNKGIYWDNYFFKASYNTMMTSAYKEKDGSIFPSTGLWGLRELVKRTFQYMNERGMLPITMEHMTSTQILPLESFATVQYDWEYHYSQGDVQDRFSRPYLLLISNGELAGTWPVLLGDHGKLSHNPWTQKTYLGVMIVYELLGWVPHGPGVPALRKLWETFEEPLLEMSEKPGVEVYRYWDERQQPVFASNPNLPGIVYLLKGKEALFAITSYAQQDETAAVTILPRLLGFKYGYRMIDVETGKEMPVKNNRVKFLLKKHDLREFRLIPE